jgi:hypothetical protein
MAIIVVTAQLYFFQTLFTKKLFSSSGVYAPAQFAFSERVSLSHDYTYTIIDGVVMGNGNQVKQFTVR